MNKSMNIKAVLLFIFLCLVTNLYAQRNDAERIEAQVKAEMELYLKKSSFESNADYENRLKNSDEKKNEITKKITEKVKAEKMKPRRSCSQITANDYDAENECFRYQLKPCSNINDYLDAKKEHLQYQIITIPMPKKFAERFLNQSPMILFAPQSIEMVNGNFLITSAIIYFDLFSYENCQKLFKLDHAIDYIDLSMTDLSAKVCYIKNTNYIRSEYFKTYKVPLVKLDQIEESSSGKLKENIYYLEWKNDTPNVPASFKISDNENDIDVADLLDKKTVVQEEGKEEIYTHVEQMPQYPGGDKEMMVFLSQNIKYPTIAQKQGIQGTVALRFVVGKNGEVIDVTVAKSLDPSCDAEAIRVVKLMPRFVPGKQNGSPVNVYYSLLIRFRLQQ